eukprot:CAMPEP_0113624224 /NCGR_PEP_ID=MMETSP0017_2-20120614/12483_1 /TAXON_ID=2856 /ORGANISM="Cylindrotheca closterium" /LENGTH=137 /DNA_ID=CAMNT_0000534239 /DNA_START=67 /DNA_END=480 /DNA_ORIENTATION=- /assembly_acc=CAM_ASM_000147
MTNSTPRKMEDEYEMPFEDLTLESIFNDYLDENMLQSADEEDIVLAALAILEADDREARGSMSRNDGGGLAGVPVLGSVSALAAAGGAAIAATGHNIAEDVAKEMGDAARDMEDAARDVGETVRALTEQMRSKFKFI